MLRPETIKHLRKKKGKMLLDIGLGNDFFFLDMTSKA